MADEKPQAINYQKVAKALDGLLKDYPGTQFLVLGGDHKDEDEIYKMFSHPAVVHTLKSHGMHTLAWENPAEFQKHADKVMWEGMDAKTYADIIGDDKLNKGGIPQSPQGRQGYELQVPMILAQKKFGNAFVLYDSPNKNLKAHYEGVHAAVGQYSAAQKTAYGKASEIWGDTYLKLQEKGMPHSDENETRAFSELMYRRFVSDPVVKAGYDSFFRLRLDIADERARAEYIKAHTVGGGAVVWAGGAHGAVMGDLDEFLGAQRLLVVRDREEYYRSSQRSYVLGEERPEGFLILSEGKIILGTDAYNAAKAFHEGYERVIVQDQPFYVGGRLSPVSPSAAMQAKP